MDKKPEWYTCSRTPEARESRIEDYLFIGGPDMKAQLAADRLGVHVRTIERYKKTLRERGKIQ